MSPLALKTIDNTFMKGSITVLMKSIFLFLTLACFSIHMHAQTLLKNTDVIPVIGSWQGTLTYLDYSSNKKTTIPATVDIEQIKAGVFTFSHQFPEEPHVKWIDTMAISKDGMMFGKEKIAAKSQLADGSLEVVTEENDKDHNKAAKLRRTYNISTNSYSMRKDVQYEGATEWVNRHEYRYEVRARTLTPKQMKADLAILKTTWELIHPGLYRYNTKQQIDSYFNELHRKTNSPMEQRQFFTLISQLNIKLNCGHSFVSYYNNKRLLKQNLYSNVFLPVLFRVIDQKFIVTHNLTDNESIKLGDEITTINGISTKTIIDSLLTVSKADGRNGSNKKLDNISFHPREIYVDRYSLFDIFFPLFFKNNLNEKKYSLGIKSSRADEKYIDVIGLSKEVRQARYIKRYSDVPNNEKSWYLRPIDKQTIVFRLGDFTTFNWKFDFNKYLDSVFTHINRVGYKNLIVDIRENEGGADEARDAVLSYLTPKNLGCVSPYRRLYRYNSIPDSLLQHLDTWDDSFKKPKPDSLFTRTKDGFYENRFPGNCEEILPKPNHFKGKIYLITDVTNSSATFIMADVFKNNKLGTIVGEVTGGTQQGINGGELFFFYLPNSKIEMDLPLIYQAPRIARPDEGIKPDYEVKTKPSDLAAMRDAQMEFVLKKLIKK